jgi:hypothetical protein
MRELIIHELFLYPKRYGDAGAFLQECQTHCAPRPPVPPATKTSLFENLPAIVIAPLIVAV